MSHTEKDMPEPISQQPAQPETTPIERRQQPDPREQAIKTIIQQSKQGLITEDEATQVIFSMVEKAERTDKFTGLLNKEGLKDELTEKMAVAKTSGVPLTILFLDAFALKSINKGLSHQRGDLAILAVADAIKASTRSYDAPALLESEENNQEPNARPGGDEFVVILLGSNLLQGVRVGQRIQRKLVETSVKRLPEYGGPLHVRIGIAQFDPENDIEYNVFLERADKAVNDAKDIGADAICLNTFNPESNSYDIRVWNNELN